MADVMSNKQVEAAAIAYVLEYEERNGRVARDTRHRGEAADLESSGRIIEVKAYGKSGRGADLWLEARQVEEARTNQSFYLYVVEQVCSGNPTLRIIAGQMLLNLLERAREKRYFEVPLPTSNYDATPIEA